MSSIFSAKLYWSIVKAYALGRTVNGKTSNQCKKELKCHLDLFRKVKENFFCHFSQLFVFVFFSQIG